MANRPLPPGATVLLVKNGSSVRVKPECVEAMLREGYREPVAPKQEKQETSPAPAKLSAVGNGKRVST